MPYTRRSRFPEMESTCTRCNATFRFWPNSYAQANFPRKARPFCTPCFRAQQLQQEAADRAAHAEHLGRLQQEAADRAAVEEAEAKRLENEAVAALRSEFDAQPDEFFRKFLRMTEKMDELTAKLGETSKRVEELTSLSERVLRIERAMSSIHY